MLKNFLYITFLFTTFILFQSCVFSGTKEVVTDNKFKLQLPGYMRPYKNLNSEATLEYGNGLREIYIMVLEDPADRIEEILSVYNYDDMPVNLDSFSKLIGINEGEFFLTPTNLSQLKDGIIHNLNVKHLSNTRTINNIPVYYHMALIEGKKIYYQVITWTLADRKNKYEHAIHKMITSFEEID